MQENRKYVRIKWPVIVQYKTIDEPHSEDQIIGANISEGGVCFIVYERFAKGTMLDMRVHVPYDSMPIFSKAEVKWIKSVGREHEKKFEVGVQFIEIDPRDEKRFRTYINNGIKKGEY